jgi:hypothetical protein
MKRLLCFLFCLISILLTACSSSGERIDVGLFTGKPCRAPCWNNLIPGQSTGSDVDQFINSLHTIEWQGKNSLVYKSGCKLVQISDKSGTTVDALVEFNIDNDKLTFIQIFHDNMPNLKKIVDYFGPPEYVEALHVTGTDAGDFYGLDIFYPKQGLAFKVSPNQKDLGFIKPNMVVANIQYFEPGDILSYFITNYSCGLGKEGAIANAQREIAQYLKPWPGFGPVPLVIITPR